MEELELNIGGLSIKRTSRYNICSQIYKSQVSGRGIRNQGISTPLLEDMNVRHGLRKIPLLIREIDLNLQENIPNRDAIMLCLSDLHGMQNADNISIRDAARDGSRIDRSNQSSCWHTGASQLINLFGGVDIILRLLFSLSIRPNKDLNKAFYHSRSSTTLQLEIRTICLEILHEVFLSIESVAINISGNHDIIEYLFFMMEDTRTFGPASVVLEDLLASNRTIIDLSRIRNLQRLVASLRDSNFASFCRILSSVIVDIDFSEDRNTLVAQDREEETRAAEKSIADSNQALLLSYPELLSRMAKLAGTSLGMPSTILSSLLPTTSSIEGQQLNRDSLSALLDDLLALDNEHDDAAGSEDAESNIALMLPRRMRNIHEVMYKVEILYVLTLFLNGKHKAEVQCKLGDLKIIPALSDLFDKLGWTQSSDRFPSHNHAESDDCDCTPQSALKLQFLRFIHSFSDHSHSLRCGGEIGLLTKIVNVLKDTPPNNSLRFWLSRAVEGFLRGSVSPPDQHFLLEKGLVEHLLGDILNPETKSKEILQSSFDLLGELMKFNQPAFQRFNNCIVTDKQFGTFISIMTSNVVDSNMFIRCIVLSLERFSSGRAALPSNRTSCRLSNLINKWEHKMYLIYKLITAISVDNLTQENVSCLNTTLIFLMFAYNHGQLEQYLQNIN
eukprot:gene18931-20836_t